MAEKKRWRDAPSPCIGVCRFMERMAGETENRCIGCAMTKRDKKRFKKIEGKAERRPFFAELTLRLSAMRRYRGWARLYRKKCVRKAVPCPLDKLPSPEFFGR